MPEALHHLHEAKRIFSQGQQLSTGEAQLDAAWARYYARMGDHARAEDLLRGAIRQASDDRYPRGELVFLTQLAGLRLARRHIWSGAALLLRTGYVFFRSEFEPGWRNLLAQLRSGTKITLGLIYTQLPTRRQRTDAVPVYCPCGAHQH